MENIAVFCVLMSCLLLSAYCSPVNMGELEEQYPGKSRVKRFTCDVLSFEAKGVKLNDAGCGVHCLIRGRTGGYCNGQRVCICR